MWQISLIHTFSEFGMLVHSVFPLGCLNELIQGRFLKCCSCDEWCSRVSDFENGNSNLALQSSIFTLKFWKVQV